ncbi:unnamed protein product [Caretta caretta]
MVQRAGREGERPGVAGTDTRSGEGREPVGALGRSGGRRRFNFAASLPPQLPTRARAPPGGDPLSSGRLPSQS